MRLGVLDVGSNTVHLLVVDAHRGAHPMPTSSVKTVLRLAERITPDGRLSDRGSQELVRAVISARETADETGCDELMAFATSAVREAGNVADVLDRVHAATGVDLQVLSGQDEARYTFLAARRWCGWSAGRLLMLDIGGGSLEVAVGIDEEPELAVSLPLGAGRLTRAELRGDPPSKSAVSALREKLDAELAPLAKRVRKIGPVDRVVATSKTFRSLARLTGAAPSTAGPRVRRTLTDTGLRQLIAFVSRMTSADLAELEGVSSSRSHQLVAGALVAEATMRALGLGELEICPWALREGVILRRLDHTDGQTDGTDSAYPAGVTGRTGPHGARWRQ
ncbi:MAG TPA: Ppx/GppA phosphatase family protein [Pseudonocardiaceae bacterium]|nr:Ppx/GppA phosphatase family protein [Pseudonocardiaceae bacterium]